MAILSGFFRLHRSSGRASPVSFVGTHHACRCYPVDAMIVAAPLICASDSITSVLRSHSNLGPKADGANGVEGSTCAASDLLKRVPSSPHCCRDERILALRECANKRHRNLIRAPKGTRIARRWSGSGRVSPPSLTVPPSTRSRTPSPNQGTPLSKAAERTLERLWSVIGETLKEFTPKECANYFAAVGYDPI